MAFPRIESDKGVSVVIYTTNAGGELPIHGAYHIGDGEWCPAAWFKNGKKSKMAHSRLDITNYINEQKRKEKTDGEIPIQSKT